MADTHTFQILAVDPDGEATSATPEALVYSICGASRIWDNPHVNDAKELADGDRILRVMEFNPSSAESSNIGCFLITLEGGRDSIEPVRQPLTEYLKERQRFSPLYVVHDDISRAIACDLYPHLYRVENLLRGYLVKFMTSQLGPGWWTDTAPSEVDEKAQALRQRNENVFGKHIDNATYALEFTQLGDFIYTYSSGNLTREQIVDKVQRLPQDNDHLSTAVADLKGELKSNYDKFFKTAFADKEFKKKWKQFGWIRNKIAHNNLFTARDLDDGVRLSNELTEIISAAEKHLKELAIPETEREALQDAVHEISQQKRNAVTTDTFIDELETLEERFSRRNGFVGLTYFIRTHLVNLGFDYTSGYRMLEDLKENNRIEVYDVPNPVHGGTTAAIRVVTPAAAEDAK